MDTDFITKNLWTTGSGRIVDFYEILKLIKESVLKGSKIFIGTDSFVSKGKTCFATAICLHSPNIISRYFFIKDNVKSQNNSLVARITEETSRSIQGGCLLMEEYGFSPDLIELHLDVSPLNSVNCNSTSKFSDMLKGYVQGYGFNYRLKPDAWASQSIADKHSK